jgi:type II secretion system protein G
VRKTFVVMFSNRRLLLMMIALLLVVTSPLDGAAFDCSKARSSTERRICADPSLVKMDDEMAALYRNVIETTKDVPGWKADQRAWLVDRNRCSDNGCLRRIYQGRLVILHSTTRPNLWAGKWWRVDTSGTNGSELLVTHVTPNTFDFDINASRGANEGELASKAILDDATRAHYQGTAEASTEGCSLAFTRWLNRLNVAQTGDSVSCGAGAGVIYDGIYVASQRDPNSPPDLVSLGILHTQTQDDLLRELLGKDYDTMVATANMIDDQEKNLDGNGATVVSMWVRGIACDTKSVLMFDGEGHLWAAVWQPMSSNPDGVVELRYYTNVSGDTSTLPKTIAAQREACPGDTVRVRMMDSVMTQTPGSAGDRAKQVRAQADMSQIKSALDRYYLDVGSYPTSDQGLLALIAAPSNGYKDWAGPYIQGIPLDPWGYRYVYRSNGSEYSLKSYGADSAGQSESSNADVHDTN